ncbi:MAG: hypothetical protein KKH98_15500, partial [Spirochaetes bacterium]|nr:hypothetical protein [Spirochaetota bacterium]
MKKLFYLFVCILLAGQFSILMAEKNEESLKVEDGKYLLVDDMNKMNNNLNGRCAVYQRQPSRAGFSKIDMKRNG